MCSASVTDLQVVDLRFSIPSILSRVSSSITAGVDNAIHLGLVKIAFKACSSSFSASTLRPQLAPSHNASPTSNADLDSQVSSQMSCD